MKVLNVYAQRPIVSIVDDRNIKFEKKCYIDVVTDEGLLSYTIKPGFITNGRSGPTIIDGFAPHFGNDAMLVAWIVHDCNYYELLSKDLADEILRQMLIKAGLSKFRSSVVKKSVQWFGDNAYGLSTDEDKEMRKYIVFEWTDLKKLKSKELEQQHDTTQREY